MNRTRRQWLQFAAACAVSPVMRAARKDFWDSKAPESWSDEDKQRILWDSPWARQGFARIEDKKKEPSVGYRSDGTQGVQMPDTRPGVPPGGVQSVPIGGEPIPKPPKGGGEPVQFRVVARWETAKPVRLAGGPEVPELTGQYYVIRLRGLPLMPPPKTKPGEPAPPDPNQDLVEAIKAGTRLERAGKAPISCAHLFTGSGNASTEVLLFFPRADAISLADKAVTLESRFAMFHLSIKFLLKEMVYRGELSL